MASRYRSLSQPAFSLVRSTITRSATKPNPSPFLHNTRSSVTATAPVPVPRSVPHLGCVQSLLPLHSAVSSARLTSCLGIDSTNSRSMTQERTPRWFEHYRFLLLKWASALLDKRLRRSVIDEL